MSYNLIQKDISNKSYSSSRNHKFFKKENESPIYKSADRSEQDASVEIENLKRQTDKFSALVTNFKDDIWNVEENDYKPNLASSFKLSTSQHNSNKTSSKKFDEVVQDPENAILTYTSTDSDSSFKISSRKNISLKDIETKNKNPNNDFYHDSEQNSKEERNSLIFSQNEEFSTYRTSESSSQQKLIVISKNKLKEKMNNTNMQDVHSFHGNRSKDECEEDNIVYRNVSPNPLLLNSVKARNQYRIQLLENESGYTNSERSSDTLSNKKLASTLASWRSIKKNFAKTKNSDSVSRSDASSISTYAGLIPNVSFRNQQFLAPVPEEYSEITRKSFTDSTYRNKQVTPSVMSSEDTISALASAVLEKSVDICTNSNSSSYTPSTFRTPGVIEMLSAQAYSRAINSRYSFHDSGISDFSDPRNLTRPGFIQQPSPLQVLIKKKIRELPESLTSEVKNESAEPSKMGNLDENDKNSNNSSSETTNKSSQLSNKQNHSTHSSAFNFKLSPKQQSIYSRKINETDLSDNSQANTIRYSELKSNSKITDSKKKSPDNAFEHTLQLMHFEQPQSIRLSNSNPFVYPSNNNIPLCKHPIIVFSQAGEHEKDSYMSYMHSLYSSNGSNISIKNEPENDKYPQLLSIQGRQSPKMPPLDQNFSRSKKRLCSNDKKPATEFTRTNVSIFQQYPTNFYSPPEHASTYFPSLACLPPPPPYYYSQPANGISEYNNLSYYPPQFPIYPFPYHLPHLSSKQYVQKTSASPRNEQTNFAFSTNKELNETSPKNELSNLDSLTSDKSTPASSETLKINTTLSQNVTTESISNLIKESCKEKPKNPSENELFQENTTKRFGGESDSELFTVWNRVNERLLNMGFNTVSLFNNHDAQLDSCNISQLIKDVNPIKFVMLLDDIFNTQLARESDKSCNIVSHNDLIKINEEVQNKNQELQAEIELFQSQLKNDTVEKITNREPLSEELQNVQVLLQEKCNLEESVNKLNDQINQLIRRENSIRKKTKEIVKEVFSRSSKKPTAESSDDEWKPVNDLSNDKSNANVISKTQAAKLIWDYELQLEICLQENEFLLQNTFRLEKGLQPLHKQDFSLAASKKVYSIITNILQDREEPLLKNFKITESSQDHEVSLLQLQKPARITNQDDNHFSFETLQKHFHEVLEDKTKMESKLSSEIDSLKKQIDQLTSKTQLPSSIITEGSIQENFQKFDINEYFDITKLRCNELPQSNFFYLSRILHDILSNVKESPFRWSTDESIARDKFFHERNFSSRLNSLTPQHCFQLIDRTCRNLGLDDFENLPNVSLGVCAVLTYTRKMTEFLNNLSIITGTDDWKMSERLIRTWRSLVLKADNTRLLKETIHKSIKLFQNAIPSPYNEIAEIEVAESNEQLIIQYNNLLQKLLQRYYNYSKYLPDGSGFDGTQSSDYNKTFYLVYQSVTKHFMKTFDIMDVEFCKVAVDRLSLKMKELTKFYRGVLHALNIPNMSVSPAEVLSFISGLYKQFSRIDKAQINPKMIHKVLQLYNELQARFNLPQLPNTEISEDTEINNQRDLLSSNSSSTVYSSSGQRSSPVVDAWKEWYQECLSALESVAPLSKDKAVFKRLSYNFMNAN